MIVTPPKSHFTPSAYTHKALAGDAIGEKGVWSFSVVLCSSKGENVSAPKAKKKICWMANHSLNQEDWNYLAHFAWSWCETTELVSEKKGGRRGTTRQSGETPAGGIGREMMGMLNEGQFGRRWTLSMASIYSQTQQATPLCWETSQLDIYMLASRRSPCFCLVLPWPLRQPSS